MIKDGRPTHVCRPSRTLLIGVAASLCMVVAVQAQTVPAEPTQSESATGKPNIVIIWGDDIGQSDISAYSHGLMGFKTPNIDRLAKEGVMFTDYYGEQSCTAGRSFSSFKSVSCTLTCGSCIFTVAGVDSFAMLYTRAITPSESSAGLIVESTTSAVGIDTSTFSSGHLPVPPGTRTALNGRAKRCASATGRVPW